MTSDGPGATETRSSEAGMIQQQMIDALAQAIAAERRGRPNPDDMQFAEKFLRAYRTVRAIELAER
jgi:hypothetical protein